MSAQEPIRFASINIEGDRHLDGIVSFLKNFRPDVACFQELIEGDIGFFERALKMKGYFVPMLKFYRDLSDPASPLVLYGLGVFSSLPVSDVRFDHYYGGDREIPKFIRGDETVLRRVLLRAAVEKNGAKYNIAVTHFTRTSDGTTSDKQREDLKKLLALLESSPDIILCGDFNAPRGGEIFTALSAKYKDNIPLEYKTSLDPTLHVPLTIVGPTTELMVDGLFTTPEYVATNVKLSEGVSDHMAVTALIART